MRKKGKKKKRRKASDADCGTSASVTYFYFEKKKAPASSTHIHFVTLFIFRFTKWHKAETDLVLTSSIILILNEDNKKVAKTIDGIAFVVVTDNIAF